MLYKSISLLLLLALGTMFFSCEDDAFSQVSNIELPAHKPLAALSLHLSAKDTVAYPYLGVSRGIIEDEPAEGPAGRISLMQNDIEIASTEIITGANRSEPYKLQFAEPLTINTGDIFKLNGAVDGFDIATATQIMPAPAQVEVVSYTRDGALDSDGERKNELLIDIIDPGNTDNYYAFALRSKSIISINCDGGGTTCDTIYNEFSVSLETIDPLAIDAYGYNVVLSDGAFNGDTYRLRLIFDNFGGPISSTFSLQCYTFTEDGFRYLRSRQAYEDARNNPFSEPVNVHDNIENGYGYFMVSNLIEKRFSE